MSAFTVRKRLGRCYELAAKALCFDRAFSDGAVLVHGMVTSPFPDTPLQTIDHAWVEDGDRLWDPTLNRFYARADYYSRFDAVAVDRYTLVEAAKQTAKHGHWGYWTDRQPEQVPA